MRAGAAARYDFLPDFCGRGPVFAVLAIMQLVALLLVLAAEIAPALFWEQLLLLSLYLHWVGLCSAAVLCQTRRWFAFLPARAGVLLSFVLLLAVTALISEIAWQLAQWLQLQPLLRGVRHDIFLLRSVSICAIVSALALRYFWVQAQWRRQVRAEGEARYQALQARIRPHFLFNSLNSIAALIGISPEKAETAVEDLAQLFRAGLSQSERRVPLRDEIEVTRAYLRTEVLRLGERLRVDWQVDDGLEQLPVPPLCLQPLLENAVTHGVEPLAGGGEVTVRVHKPAMHLLIEVTNPIPSEPRDSLGTQSALDNIRQRLKLLYGDEAELFTESAPGRFRARLKLPVADLAALVA